MTEAVRTVRVGTRGSALALAQSRQVADALADARGVPCELVVVRTEGDVSAAPLAAIGGTGVFAGALRERLVAGECDVVVHSLKDLPVAPAAGLTIAAIPEREDARDALCARDGRTLQTLRPGARVGTGSPRRRAQLLAARPDLEVVELRGNVDTRLGRVVSGPLDAVVLSLAGLGRLGRADAVTEALPLETWPTAAGQGALAVEVREGDEDLVAPLADDWATASADAERALLGALEAGCTAPVGVASSASAEGGSVWAEVLSPDGTARFAGRRSVPPAGSVALRAARLRAAALDLAGELLAAGAAGLVAGAPR